MKERTEDTTVACPIVYGSLANVITGRRLDDSTATHKWTLFVRGPNGEDLSTFVEKVVFTLHPSFEKPIREVFEYPFEVNEVGWGEFEAGIQIIFKDEDEAPVDVIHLIKLYHPVEDTVSINAKKPVMSEIYDEIVFMNPGVVFFRECLLQYSDKTIGGTANNSASSSVTKEAPASVVSGPPNKKTKHSQASTPAVPVVRASTILPEYWTMTADIEARDMAKLSMVHAHIKEEVAAARLKLIQLTATSCQQSLKETLSAAP